MNPRTETFDLTVRLIGGGNDLKRRRSFDDRRPERHFRSTSAGEGQSCCGLTNPIIVPSALGKPFLKDPVDMSCVVCSCSF